MASRHCLEVLKNNLNLPDLCKISVAVVKLSKYKSCLSFAQVLARVRSEADVMPRAQLEVQMRDSLGDDWYSIMRTTFNSMHDVLTIMHNAF
jgi:hypothetical protein